MASANEGPEDPPVQPSPGPSPVIGEPQAHPGRRRRGERPPFSGGFLAEWSAALFGKREDHWKTLEHEVVRRVGDERLVHILEATIAKPSQKPKSPIEGRGLRIAVRPQPTPPKHIAAARQSRSALQGKANHILRCRPRNDRASGISRCPRRGAFPRRGSTGKPSDEAPAAKPVYLDRSDDENPETARYARPSGLIAGFGRIA